MPTTEPLSTGLAGTWELLHRVTRTASGRDITSDRGKITALLIYDGKGSFSAQFMSENRSPESSGAANNTRLVAGYDAYFGRYVVDDSTGAVTQTIEGSLSAENVGQILTRRMTVTGDQLVIEVETESDEGEPALITLTWRRR